MKTLLRIVATAILAVGLTAGIASAATGTLDTTGPDSQNEIRIKNKSKTDVDVNNNTDVNGAINQTATSGDAKVKHNTNAGSATSGNATNKADAKVTVANDNRGVLDCGCAASKMNNDSKATIKNTGPDSTNKVTIKNKYKYEVEVNNNTTVNANVNQTANSGDAKVYGNTNGGSAKTGNASNSSSLVFSVSNKN